MSEPRSLDEIYASLPVIHCKGKCQECCGPIGGSPEEHRRMIEAGGDKGTVVRLPQRGFHTTDLTCAYLTPLGLCGVYDARPMVCRLWGLTEDMKCPYGCRPQGGWLSRREGLALLGEAMIAGGAYRGHTFDELRAAMTNPALMHEAGEIIAHGMRNERKRRGRRG